jgi:NADH-quinone oxidoreductase subunit J
MAAAILYTSCVLASAGLYLLVRPCHGRLKAVGALLGLAAVGWLLVALPALAVGDPEARPEILFMIFALIAVASAVRMITHNRPVYAALYFILVVLSSAGLFLLLQAEFMAFALIIVYAGAILITYLFVLMLAQQSARPDDPTGQPDYDLLPREPAAAVLVSFVMLALFSSMIYRGDALPAPPRREVVLDRAWTRLESMPGRLEDEVLAVQPDLEWPPLANPDGGLVTVREDGTAYVEGIVPGAAGPVRVDLPETALPENVQNVGLALVAEFPVSLELAGVILLMAMFGAVVLARKQVELGEDEVREAAGLPRYAFHDEHEHEPPAEGAGR